MYRPIKGKQKTVLVNNKDRSTFNLPTIQLITEENRKEEEYQDELNAIDELIVKRSSKRKSYSKSLLNPYTPLTKIQKVKVLADMDENSSNRFKQYSDIFDKIKEQISDINTSLTGSFAENNNNKDSNLNKISIRKAMKIQNCYNIEEIEDEQFNSPKYVMHTMPTYGSDNFIDQETMNENKAIITPRQTTTNRSSILLLHSQQKKNYRLSTESDHENNELIKAKKEFDKLNKVKSNNRYNSGNESNIELRNVPKINELYSDCKLYDDYDKKSTIQTDTCNCIIQ